MEGKEYLIALTHFERFGPRRLKRLFEFFGSWERVWKSSVQELQDCGLSPQAISLFTEFKQKTDPDKIVEDIQKKNIKLVFLNDPSYPSLLREIYDPPFLLYYRGTLDEKTFALPVAIVGTRKATSYGKQAAQEIIRGLTNHDITVVSGLALGIDACAHEASLESGGRTVAFLGSGVDEIYPRTNYQLAERIIENGGAIISEFVPGTLPFKTNFPRRNRLIAGSTLGTIVIEAAERSGALITARYALEEGREVFAVPGSIHTESAQGPIALLRAGARVAATSDDITDALGLDTIKQQAVNQQRLPMSKEEGIILELLGAETLQANELARLANLDITVINSRLTIMEMKGLVKHLGNMHYIRLRQPSI